MANPIKIGIIGDYNYDYNAHQATNIAIDHTVNQLKAKVDYYWIRTQEAANFKRSQMKKYDAIWVASGPFESNFFIQHALQIIMETQTPVLITGEAYRFFIDHIVQQHQLNPQQEKVLSTNLNVEAKFEQIEVKPLSENLKTLYDDEIRTEFTASRFSIYPHFLALLKDGIIDIEAINQLEDPEIISLKSRNFCVASMSLPQVSSTREHPHPLITAFFQFILNVKKK